MMLPHTIAARHYLMLHSRQLFTALQTSQRDTREVTMNYRD